MLNAIILMGGEFEIKEKNYPQQQGVIDKQPVPTIFEDGECVYRDSRTAPSGWVIISHK